MTTETDTAPATLDELIAIERERARKMTKLELAEELVRRGDPVPEVDRKDALVEAFVDARIADYRDATGTDKVVPEDPVEIEGEVVAETDEAAPARISESQARDDVNDPDDNPTDEEIAASETQALALRAEPVVHEMALLPTTAEFDSMMAIATRVANTTMVPKAYRGKPDDVVAAILTGRELGLGPMQSLRDIHVVDGKPSLSANLLLARLRANGVSVLESTSTAERAWIRARRRDTGEVAEVEWTIEEARAATYTSWEGPRDNRVKVVRALVEKDNWVSYPTDMLWARAVGRLARRLGPDLIGAAMPYSSEEVQDWDNDPGPGSTMDATPTGTPAVRGERRVEPGWNEPKDWRELSTRLSGLLGQDEAGAWMEEIAEKGYQHPTIGSIVHDAELDAARKKDLWTRLLRVLRSLDAVEGDLGLNPDLRAIANKAIGEAFDGALAFEGPPWALSAAEAESGRPARVPAPVADPPSEAPAAAREAEDAPEEASSPEAGEEIRSSVTGDPLDF